MMPTTPPYCKSSGGSYAEKELKRHFDVEPL